MTRHVAELLWLVRLLILISSFQDHILKFHFYIDSSVKWDCLGLVMAKWPRVLFNCWWTGRDLVIQSSNSRFFESSFYILQLALILVIFGFQLFFPFLTYGISNKPTNIVCNKLKPFLIAFMFQNVNFSEENKVYSIEPTSLTNHVRVLSTVKFFCHFTCS